VFGAVDPGSGTASMLEVGRALGTLVRFGWKPRRTIVICHWDGEEPGLLGSTEWVEANRAELQAKAVAYINTDVGVSGPNFSASATPSLNNFVREITRDVPDPKTGKSVYEAWRDYSLRSKDETSGGTAREVAGATDSGEPPLTALGAGSDFSPFFDFAGIASMDSSFTGDYGVYHSLYDDFYWMKRFGDPTFAYHVALARIYGTIALRLDEADVIPLDYTAYAAEISRAESDFVARAGRQYANSDSLKAVSEASSEFSVSAQRASKALEVAESGPLDFAKAAGINRALTGVDQSLLAPQGLSGRPWFKHTIYAPGSYSGYAAEMLPGLAEALDRNDPAALKIEAESLAAALRRGAATLDVVTRIVQGGEPLSMSGH